MNLTPILAVEESIKLWKWIVTSYEVGDVPFDIKDKWPGWTRFKKSYNLPVHDIFFYGHACPLCIYTLQGFDSVICINCPSKKEWKKYPNMVHLNYCSNLKPDDRGYYCESFDTPWNRFLSEGEDKHRINAKRMIRLLERTLKRLQKESERSIK